MRKALHNLTQEQIQRLVSQLENTRAMCHGFSAALNLVINEGRKPDLKAVRKRLQAQNSACARLLDEVSDYVEDRR